MTKTTQCCCTFRVWHTKLSKIMAKSNTIKKLFGKHNHVITVLALNEVHISGKMVLTRKSLCVCLLQNPCQSGLEEKNKQPQQLQKNSKNKNKIQIKQHKPGFDLGSYVPLINSSDHSPQLSCPDELGDVSVNSEEEAEANVL